MKRTEKQQFYDDAERPISADSPLNYLMCAVTYAQAGEFNLLRDLWKKSDDESPTHDRSFA